MASRAVLRKAILHPGICSASVSDRRMWTGFPGEWATHSAMDPSPGGAMLGGPTPTCFVFINVLARYRTQCGSGYESSSIYATIRPLTACSHVFRADARP